MIGIVTALKCEAESLIEHFHLKCFSQKKFFPIYFKDSIFLIISGIGKLSAAAATGYLYALTKENPFMAWLNVGISGHGREEIGKGFLAHRIQDASSKRSFYPAFPWKLRCETADVLTVDNVERSYFENALYEMEGSGFYEAASRFTSPELIHAYKVVSDNLTVLPSKDSKWVSQLISKNLSEIVPIIENLRSLIQEMENSHEVPEISRFLTKWKFTETEKIFLKRSLQRWKACGEKNVWHPKLLSCRKAAEVLTFLEQEIEKCFS